MTSIGDTSFLVALLNKDDAHHDRALAGIARGPRPKILQPVLTEWLGHMQIHVRKAEGVAAAQQAVRDAFQYVVDTLRFPVGPLEHQTRAVDIFMRYHELSFADAAAIADAPPGQGSLWTFDGRHAKIHRAERG